MLTIEEKDFSNTKSDIVYLHDDCITPVMGLSALSFVEGSYRDFNYSGGFNTVKRNSWGNLAFNNFYIERVLYNDPVTVVFWSDGTKTVAKTHNDDVYNKETGLALCLLKKLAGTTNVHDILKYWLPSPEEKCPITITNKDVRKMRKETK